MSASQGQLGGHAVEIGAGDRYSSQLLPIAGQFTQVQLVEPNVILYEDLVAAVREQNLTNVTVHNCAVTHTTARGQLVHLGYGSYLVGAPSFLRLSCELEAESFWAPLIGEVDLITTDRLESSRPPIDFLVLTNHGSELSALTTMRSRPAVIRTKFYAHNEAHHRYYGNVVAWLTTEGYQPTALETNQFYTFHHLEWKRIQQ